MRGPDLLTPTTLPGSHRNSFVNREVQSHSDATFQRLRAVATSHRRVGMTSHVRTIAAALLCILGAPLSVRAEEIAPAQIRGNLFSTCLATDEVGWVVGELGRILRTEDGGKTWTRQHAGVKKPFLTISCIDERRAWVGGKSGFLYRTTDGGATWEALSSGTKKHIFDLQFRDARHGVAVGDWGLLMYTEDGGDTWTRVGIPDGFVLSPMAEDIGLEPDDTILYALTMPDDSHGWTVGEFGTIMATEDGGRTWRQQRSPIDTTLFGVYFDNRREGWAVGTDSEILHTADGGRTWQRIEAPHHQRSYYDVRLSGPEGWIVGDAGTLLRSSDNGRTWTIEPLPIELAASWFRALALRPGGRGIAAGAHGLLYRISNDGARDLRANGSPTSGDQQDPS